MRKKIDDVSVFCRFCGADLSVGIRETEEQRAEREYAENNNKLAQAKALMDNNRFEDARQIFLEITGFKNADKLAEKCLSDAMEYRRNSTYLHAKSILEQKHPTVEQIDSAREDFEALGDYLDSAEKAVECGQLRKKVIEYEIARTERSYSKARKIIENPSPEEQEILSAKRIFISLGDYKDSADLVGECDKIVKKINAYRQAKRHFSNSDNILERFEVINEFEALDGFFDSVEYINKCKEKIYSEAVIDADSTDSRVIKYAENIFTQLGDYKDSKEKAEQLQEENKERRKRAEKEANDQKYELACEVLTEKKPTETRINDAIQIFESLPEEYDCKDKIEQCNQLLARIRKREKRKKIIIRLAATGSALAVIMTLIAVNVIIPEAKYSEAANLYNSGRYDEAALAFHKMVGYKDSYYRLEESQNAYVDKLVGDGNYEEAYNYCGSNDMSSRAETVSRQYIDKLIENNSFDEALEYTSSHLGENGTNEIKKIYYSRGEFYENNGEYLKAIEDYKSAQDYSDEGKRMLNCNIKYGDSLFRQENYTLAAKYYGIANETKKQKDCYNALGDMSFAQGGYIAAISYYEDAGNSEVLNKCYYQQGLQDYYDADYRSALVSFEKAGSIGESYSESCKSIIYDEAVSSAYSGYYTKAYNDFQLILDYKDSQDYSDCCKAMSDVLNGGALFENYKIIRSLTYSHNLKLADTCMNSHIFTGAGNLYKWEFDCYCAALTFTDGHTEVYSIMPDNLIVKATYQSMYDEYDEYYFQNNNELKRLCYDCYYKEEYYDMHYDTNYGYYILDQGTRVYFSFSGDKLLIHNDNDFFYDGEYYKHTYGKGVGM